MDLGIPGLSDAEALGSGGFGTVYRARQDRLNRTVAVKILPRTTGDETAELRFQREAAALGTLATHPNIVTVYDSGLTERGEPYLIMELVERGSLADVINADGPVPWSRVLEIGVGLSSALASAHHAGILHRDIKPENVLLSDFDEAMLADFGIARMAGQAQTASATITGSAAHLAPELLHGEPPSVKSDLYALGSTLFHALAGTPAFVRSTDQTIAAAYQRILTAPVPDLRPRDVPDEICSFLERLLSKDPDGRHNNAEGVGENIRRLQRAAGLDPTPLLVRRDVTSVDEDVAAEAMPPRSVVTSDDATTDHSLQRHQPRPLMDTGTDAEGRLPVPPAPAGQPATPAPAMPPPAMPPPAMPPPTVPAGRAGASGPVSDPAIEDRTPKKPKRRVRRWLIGIAVALLLLVIAGTLTDQARRQGGGLAGPADVSDPITGEADITPTQITDAPVAAGLGPCDLVVAPNAGSDGDGSPGAPFGSIAELLDNLSSGDVGCLAGGIYDENVTIDGFVSGASGNPINLAAIAGHDVRLTGRIKVEDDGAHVRISNLTLIGNGALPPLRVNAPSVELLYLTLTNPGGTCLDVGAPEDDREAPVSVIGTVFRRCGTPRAAGVVVRNSASLLMTSSVFHTDGDGPGPAVAFEDASFLSLQSVTFIAHATALRVTSNSAATDRAVNFSQNLIVGPSGPLAVNDDGAETPGFFNFGENCVSPARLGGDRELPRLEVSDWPATISHTEERVEFAQLTAPADGDYTLGRDSGCQGFGAAPSVLSIRDEL